MKKIKIRKLREALIDLERHRLETQGVFNVSYESSLAYEIGYNITARNEQVGVAGWLTIYDHAYLISIGDMKLISKFTLITIHHPSSAKFSRSNERKDHGFPKVSLSARGLMRI